IARRTSANMRQNVVIAVLTVAGLLAGVLTGDVHMAGGMLIHELSVLAVIANGMRLWRARVDPVTRWRGFGAAKSGGDDAPRCFIERWDRPSLRSPTQRSFARLGRSSPPAGAYRWRCARSPARWPARTPG